MDESIQPTETVFIKSEPEDTYDGSELNQESVCTITNRLVCPYNFNGMTAKVEEEMPNEVVDVRNYPKIKLEEEITNEVETNNEVSGVESESRTYKSTFPLSQTRNNGAKIFECNQCDRFFSDKGGLTKHILSIHEKVRYNCNQCVKSYSDQSSLLKHMGTHKGKIIVYNECEKSLFGLSDTGIRFKCNQCEKHYSDKGGLTKHILTTHEKIRYNCNQCEKSYSDQSSISKHIKTHKGNTFEHNQSYTIKKDNMHKINKYYKVSLSKNMLSKEINKFKCDKCVKFYSEQSSLLKHVRTHKGEKIENNQCDLCGHDTGIIFNCNQCEKYFSNKITLFRHMRLHTKKKIFECNQCDEYFFGDVDFSKHLLSRH